MKFKIGDTVTVIWGMGVHRYKVLKEASDNFGPLCENLTWGGTAYIREDMLRPVAPLLLLAEEAE